MRFFVFVSLLTATLADTNPCPYLVTNDNVDGVWSCGSGTRPCSANVVVGWDDLCPTTEVECTQDCWTGSLCRECVCQDGLVPDTTNTADRLECIEPEAEAVQEAEPEPEAEAVQEAEPEPEAEAVQEENNTLVIAMASYGAILLVLAGFFVKSILDN